MKFKEIVNKSNAELEKELVSLREQLKDLTVKTRLAQNKATHQIRQTRKDIARVLTALKMKS